MHVCIYVYIYIYLYIYINQPASVYWPRLLGRAGPSARPQRAAPHTGTTVETVAVMQVVGHDDSDGLEPSLAGLALRSQEAAPAPAPRGTRSAREATGPFQRLSNGRSQVPSTAAGESCERPSAARFDAPCQQEL